MQQTTKSSNDMNEGIIGASLVDVYQTISHHLTLEEKIRYTNLVQKAANHSSLNLKDLLLLDKIDAFTVKYHGLFLRDNVVTAARIRASKKLNIELNDVEKLRARFRLMDYENEQRAIKVENEFLGAFGLHIYQKIGDICIEDFYQAMYKINNSLELDIQDLETFSLLEKNSCGEENLCIHSEIVQSARRSASERLGVKFTNLSKETICA